MPARLGSGIAAQSSTVMEFSPKARAVDYSVDVVMQSKRRLTDHRYTIEVAIPFASLKLIPVPVFLDDLTVSDVVNSRTVYAAGAYAIGTSSMVRIIQQSPQRWER